MERSQKWSEVIPELNDSVLNLIDVGVELKFAIEAAKIFNQKGIKTRVILFFSRNLFGEQFNEYQCSILKRRNPTIVIEAFAPNGWERYATAEINGIYENILCLDVKPLYPINVKTYD